MSSISSSTREIERVYCRKCYENWVSILWYSFNPIGVVVGLENIFIDNLSFVYIWFFLEHFHRVKTQNKNLIQLSSSVVGVNDDHDEL